ncbi:hypothetical protein XBJ2_500002 [Xenorhabdus bovienii str. Jollieti]|uniref:Uncharacterized protein n=1 Tax=Xenorhabdus bovienii (strain SS-2004) TaxID=406818 RepID=D3V000_XENBS|nr:hypothetical protein XBJ1_1156 [Xenorhabdus bovienii SS-2004]CDH30027.1 hypothetical protein XBJ2_500002 [Xenorhabdus bovienii str. Jollieti]
MVVYSYFSYKFIDLDVYYSYRACHTGIKEQIVDLAMNNNEY